MLLLLINSFLTYWVIEMSKETTTDSDRFTNMNGDLLIVNSPSVYVSLLDLALLPVDGLDKLARLSFQTVDGAVYNVLVAGAKFLQDNTLTIYIANSMSMLITATSATLTFTDEHANVQRVLVYIPENTASRRLEMLRNDDSGDLAARCSTGLCYHTFDEILSLQGLVDGSSSGAVGADGQTRFLQVSGASEPATPTYAQVTADANALSTAKVSAVGQAQSYINSVLDGINQKANETVTLKFTMFERCSNHALLKETCSKYFCNALSGYSALEIRNEQNTPPYPGMTCDDGLWLVAECR